VNRFDRRTALITGGAHGIGRACARRLASEGAAVVVADVDDQAATAVSAELNEAGARAISIGCDVTDAGSVRAAVDVAVERCGGIDVLVNTAGGDRMPADPVDPNDDHWAAMLDFNLVGVARCIRAALPICSAPRRAGMS
jgi:NAD(P)-dependent dehydrogenase (short-subunit alcohol dehydrogenase family)